MYVYSKFLVLLLLTCACKGYPTDTGSGNTTKNLQQSNPLTCGSENHVLIPVYKDVAQTQPLFVSCFDTVKFTTLWTYHHIGYVGPDDCEEDTDEKATAWGGANRFPGLSLSRSYPGKGTAAAQRTILGQQISDSKAQEFLTGTQKFLARGHLVPCGDFDPGVLRGYTYDYANHLPQWQVMNNGNWKRFENAVKREAGKIGVAVFTGTAGVSTLTNANNQQIPVSLGVGENGIVVRDTLPIPRFMWKCFKNPYGNNYALLVMRNNPHNNAMIKEDEIICPNTCKVGNIPKPWWGGTVDPSNPEALAYCCEIDSCLKVGSIIKESSPFVTAEHLKKGCDIFNNPNCSM